MEHRMISLAEQVFERLEYEILTGKYQKGETLTELKLVSDLGVSRTPIREALRRLEQEHLVEMRTKGILIVGVTEQDLEDIFDIRLRIEGIASAKAALRITPEELDELRKTLELQEFYVGKRDADQIKGMDSKFHQLIYRFCGSSVFYDMLMPLHKKIQKYRKISVEDTGRAGQSAREHREIFEAIEAHDASLAQERTEMHIANARDYILQSEKNTGGEAF